MNRISINNRSLEERATALKNAGNNFDEQVLTPIDDESTISANQNAQNAFQEAQQGNSLFGQALETSSEQIKEIGDRFLELDRQAAATMHLS